MLCKLNRTIATRFWDLEFWAFRCQFTSQLSFFSSNESIGIGEETYQRALQAFTKAEEFASELEEKRNRQQYEAWKRTEERQLEKASFAGVAVVKTIAKQIRKGNSDSNKAEFLQKTAKALLEEAALKYDHPTALVRLANAILEKEENEKEIRKAMKYYRQAGKGGLSAGWYNLGHLLWNQSIEAIGEMDPSTSKEASMEAFCNAIELGDVDAMYFVGAQYLSEDNESTERKRAGLELITTAAEEKGHSGALYYLSLFYYNGYSSLQINACSVADFMQRLDAAANAGSAEALFLRGHNFYHGEDGRDQEYSQALNNFLQASDAGHADAAVSAGAMFHEGLGTPLDHQKAFELYQLGGELGNIEGWRNVVRCYVLGEGVQRSVSTAEYIARTMLKEKKDNNENLDEVL
mmetsp:Transcript_37538/g.42901  ORF Transcript_37538/g.42901 Transcript_37538/m.42901 type:complete len:407 (-) Transcript_37538:194-1414(-)|eukprot:CAMPEP_0194170802 /NCGR_PEP_ID=MMETSP0154-20130528/5462_1 /TAXON_ID=1049557 /ORGANISM="Thalassiothrix antarctica, Strain L6-D1" /LENGTH=406 /DNA_ID=CAMNT_0038882847 /DNA_START=84 /DNA_END=1304 /DNA_ORIENTATION=+